MVGAFRLKVLQVSRSSMMGPYSRPSRNRSGEKRNRKQVQRSRAGQTRASDVGRSRAGQARTRNTEGPSAEAAQPVAGFLEQLHSETAICPVQRRIRGKVTCHRHDPPSPPPFEYPGVDWITHDINYYIKPHHLQAITDWEKCCNYSIRLPHQSPELGFTTALDVGPPLQGLLRRATVRRALLGREY